LGCLGVLGVYMVCINQNLFIKYSFNILSCHMHFIWKHTLNINHAYQCLRFVFFPLDDWGFFLNNLVIIIGLASACDVLGELTVVTVTDLGSFNEKMFLY
jgi:hypothetical protein